MTNEQLTELERLANDANEALLHNNLIEQANINKDFHVAAREVTPALIAEVRRLKKECEEWKRIALND